MGMLTNRFGRRHAVATDGAATSHRTADRTTPRRRIMRPGAASGAAIGARRLLARLITLLTLVVVAIIVLGIVLILLKANPENGIVDAIRETARWLTQPFDTIFDLERRRTEIAVNWGIAAAVYLAIGSFLAKLVAPGSRSTSD